MNIRERIRKEIAKQKSIEGDKCQDKLLLEFLNSITTENQWSAFVYTRFYRYGKFSYESYRFYYPNKELLRIMRYDEQHEVQEETPAAKEMRIILSDAKTYKLEVGHIGLLMQLQGRPFSLSLHQATIMLNFILCLNNKYGDAIFNIMSIMDCVEHALCIDEKNTRQVRRSNTPAVALVSAIEAENAAAYMSYLDAVDDAVNACKE